MIIHNQSKGRHFTFEELQFIQAIGWKVCSVSSILDPSDGGPIIIKMLLYTFYARHNSNAKTKTNRKYLCKEYEELQNKRLVRLLCAS